MENHRESVFRWNLLKTLGKHMFSMGTNGKQYENTCFRWDQWKTIGTHMLSIETNDTLLILEMGMFRAIKSFVYAHVSQVYSQERHDGFCGMGILILPERMDGTVGY